MREFKDAENNRWKIDLTFGSVLALKNASEGRFNLLHPEAGGGSEKPHDTLYMRLAGAEHLEGVYEMLYLLVRDQLQDKGIDAAKFGFLMAAECLIEAQRQFLLEWMDFFRRLQQMEKAALLERLINVNAKAVELVQAKLSSGVMQQADAKLAAKVAAELNRAFGELQASLESTPAE